MTLSSSRAISDDDPSMNGPLFSVIIPTRNRGDMIGHCLGSLQAQRYPPDKLEIIVVDDGSSDRTEAVVKTFQVGDGPKVRYIFQDQKGLNAARNAGLRAAKGDPIAFIDDDAEAPSDWVSAYANAVRRHPHAGCLGGPVRMRFEARPPRICEMETWAWEGELDYGSQERSVTPLEGQHFNGVNMVVRQSAIAAIGLFNEVLSGPGDEMEWQRRLATAGHVFVYVPSAWVWHRRRAEDLRMRKLLARRFRQGRYFASYYALEKREVSIWHSAWTIPFYVAHAVRKRCFGALLDAAWKLGFLVEGLSARRER